MYQTLPTPTIFFLNQGGRKESNFFLNQGGRKESNFFLNQGGREESNFLSESGREGCKGYKDMWLAREPLS